MADWQEQEDQYYIAESNQHHLSVFPTLSVFTFIVISLAGKVVKTGHEDTLEAAQMPAERTALELPTITYYPCVFPLS